MTFDDIMAPLGGAAFMKEYLHKKPIHLEGGADKFANVMNWNILDRLLGANTIWSTASLLLMLDKEPVPAQAYSEVAFGRDGGQVLRPDPAKVKGYLRQGATLVANDIDQLTPELSSFCAELERMLGGKVQANLYLSSRRRQGFKVHYDTHDVFAVHVEGEKVWNVFEGREDAPIAHEMFKSQPQSYHEEKKGDLWREVRLKPGHLLYLPRGQYHYALADDGGCIHIAFGVTYPIGLDVVSAMYQQMIAEVLSRRNLPQGDDEALRAHLAGLGDRAKAVLTSDAMLEMVRRFQRDFHYQREVYNLRGLLDSGNFSYEVRAANVRLVEQAGRYGLVRTGDNRAVEVPADVADLVAWVLERRNFGRCDIDEAFSAREKPQIDRFLEDMQRMALVCPS
ncbi:MAG: hypothetical protein KDG54_07885 [Geminicoccaceae bacterium]|nr:hypothetical protein [Geminicoccaceae bacterium]